MSRKSAGILVHRHIAGDVEILLVHPGGPFFKGKDAGAWSIPKGEFTNDEDALAAAKREFAEELGFEIDGAFSPLSPVKQKSGKMVYAWSVEASPDISNIRSNTFEIEWPPRSGKMQQFPEVDKVAWFTPAVARTSINPAQAAFIDELLRRIADAA